MRFWSGLLLCLLTVSCGGENVPSEPSGAEGPDMSRAIVSAAGGRERAVVRWEGLPAEITSLALTLDPARGAVAIPAGGGQGE